MTRFHAFSYHMTISLVIFFALSYVIVELWYPDFFFAIDGGWEGIQLIIGVDLILGPVLTLVVFKLGKPGLKFDLFCIGLLQMLCLSAGVYVVYSERPIFFIYYDKHFYSASTDTFTNYGLQAPDLSRQNQILPVKVISKMPDNPIEEADFRLILFRDNIPAWVYEPSYFPLDSYMDDVILDGISESEIRQRDVNGHLDRWLSDYGGEFSDYAFIPIHSRYRDAFVGIDKKKKQFVDIVEIPPPL